MSKRKETPDILGGLMGEQRRDPEPKPEERPKKRTPKERLQKRATYDISAELKQAIADRATRLGIPASQLAHFLLLHAWDDLEAGRIDPEPYLEPSTSPAFRNNLNVDAAADDLEKG